MTAPLLLGRLLAVGGLLIPLAVDAAPTGVVPALPLEATADAVYLVEAAVYDGSGGVSTLSASPRPLLGPKLLAAGPLLSGLILRAEEFGVTTVRWSDRGWTSEPTDTVANTHFEGRAAQPLDLQWALPLAPDDSARMVVSAQLELDNRDGALDAVADLGVDGRAVTITRGAVDDAYADFRTIFQGYGVAWSVTGDALQLTLRERGWLLSTPIADLYGGTGGADGGAEVEGKPIPLCYGYCRNVTPALVSTASLVFQVHDGRIGAIDAVYDRGVALTADGDYASYAALVAASITAGRYATCLAEGYFRLASTPSYPVTADVKGDASASSLDGGGYVSSPALIARRILLDRGALSLSALDTAAIEAAHLVSGGTAGIYITDQSSIEDVVSAVCAGAFLRWGQNRDGTIGLWRIAPPTSPAYAIGVAELLEDPQVLPLPDSVSPCVWRVTAGYQRNWTPMSDADIAGSVSAAYRQFLAQPFRTTAEADTARQTRNLLAKSLALATIYDAESDAQSLCSNLLTLFDQGRRLLQVDLPAAAHPLDLRTEVRLTHPRFGAAGGVDMVALSLREDCGTRSVSAVLFG